MSLVSFFIVMYLVYKDARYLQSRDAALYTRRIGPAPRIWLAWMLVFMFGALPVYVYRRVRFQRALRADASQIVAEQRLTGPEYTAEVRRLFIYWFNGLFILSLVMELLGIHIAWINNELNRMLILGVAAPFLMIYLIATARGRFRWNRFRDLVALRKKGKPFWKVIVIPLLIGTCLAVLSSLIMVTRDIQPVTPLSQALDTATSSMALIIFGLLAVAVAPLVEEIIFRGYFYHYAKRMRGKVFAICFISLVFAVMHVGQYWGDWMAIFVVAVMGLVLTLLRSWTGSTVASAVAHYTYNLLLTILPLLLMVNIFYLQYQAFYTRLTPHQKEELLLKSIKSEPDFYDAYNDLAWLYAERKENLDQALELINHALAQDPGNEAFLDTKAEVLFQKGEYARAAAIEQDLVTRYPEREFFRQQLEKFKAAQDAPP